MDNGGQHQRLLFLDQAPHGKVSVSEGAGQTGAGGGGGVRIEVLYVRWRRGGHDNNKKKRCCEEFNITLPHPSSKFMAITGIATERWS